SPAPSPPLPHWSRIYAVAAGTFVAGLVWLPVFLQNSYGDKLTDWIQVPRVGFAWISPLFQAFAAWVTMQFLLPVESPHLWIVLVSGAVMLIYFIWLLPILFGGLKVRLKQPETHLMTQVFVLLVVSAIALFFIFTYFFGIDLTRGARYNFIYFPAVIVLLGASFALSWNPQVGRPRSSGKKVVGIIWLMGFFSAVTVLSNLGYQKYYRPDLFVELIQKTSQVPVLIATTQRTHVHIGEMMGVAREFKIQNLTSPTPLFLLAHQDQNPNTSSDALLHTLKELPQPLDLWLVNFYAPLPEEVKKCAADMQSLPSVNGYEYKLYHCR
ncbi:glycosyl transferase, partial [[Scytonema hofmanni] UTEX B 1581]